MNKLEIIEQETNKIIDAMQKYNKGKHSSETLRQIIKISLNFIWNYAKGNTYNV